MGRGFEVEEVGVREDWRRVDGVRRADAREERCEGEQDSRSQRLAFHSVVSNRNGLEWEWGV